MPKKWFLCGTDVNLFMQKKQYAPSKAKFENSTFFPNLASSHASGSKGVTEINGKEHESSFHPRFIHEGFVCMPPP